MTSQGSAHLPARHRLNFVRFRIGDDELAVSFTVALELAERASRALDDDAREVAGKIRGAGASRPVVLTDEQLAALARVTDLWERNAETVRELRQRL
jgi:predicted nucleic acid-binding protein